MTRWGERLLVGSRSGYNEDMFAKKVWGLPKDIIELIESTTWTEDVVGLSGSFVALSQDYVLKVSEVSEEALHEIHNYRHLGHLGLFPDIIHTTITPRHCVLIMKRINGVTLDGMPNSAILPLMIKIYHHLQRIPLQATMIDQRLSVRLALAKQLVEAGEVDVDWWDEDLHQGRFETPQALYDYLNMHRPVENLHFCHGDLTFENILISDQDGFRLIDVGRSGLADPYQDLALLIRSARYRLEGIDLESMEKALGITLDRFKLDYYLLLDELF